MIPRICLVLIALGAFTLPRAIAQPIQPQPGLGELVARVRILTQNVLGESRKDHCRFRYEHLGDLLARRNPVADVIGLQEYFSTSFLGILINSCNPEPLRRAITATGRYLTDEKHPCATDIFEFPPFVNGCRFHPSEGIDGGVGLLTQHRIERFESGRWKNHGDQRRSQGFLFTRVRLNSTASGDPLRLDVYVVHVHGECAPRPACQRLELEELADKIAELSSQSGNPVFVLGDFNLDGPRTLADVSSFPEYRVILEALGNPRDLWLEAHPAGVPERGLTKDECQLVRPVFGSPELEPDTFTCSGSTTACGCRGRRIDYQFLVTDPRLTNTTLQVRFAHPDQVRVARFFALDDGPVRVALSDHYGVDAILEIRRPPELIRTN